MIKTEPVIEKSKLRSESRRQAILEIARDLFLTEGFTQTSMSLISQHLGGSKGTLYNYFTSKEALLEAIVTEQCQNYRTEMEKLLSEGPDVKTVLRHWGQRYLSKLSDDKHMRMHRLFTVEAQKRPEFGTLFYENGPKMGAELLASYLKRAHEEGHLKLKDPLVAAYQFMSLCQVRIYKQRLFNYAAAPTQAEVALEIDQAVETFFLAFGTN